MRIIHAALAVVALIAGASPAFSAGVEKLWELDGLKQPESAVIDPAAGVLYVGEVIGDMRGKDGEGQITKVSPEGKIVQSGWVKGLNAPKGLGLSGGKLYVADIDELVEIDIASAKVTARHKVEGAIFLNDVTTDPAGRVFVSDTGTNTIWALQGGEMKTWLRSDRLNGPNGLAIEGDTMVIAAFGKPPADGKPAEPGNLLEAPLSGDSVRTLGDGRPVGSLDGLVPLGGGKYLATDYIGGPLLLIDESGSFEKLADLPSGTADLAFDPASRIAFVPQNKAGKLTAFRIP